MKGLILTLASVLSVLLLGGRALSQSSVPGSTIETGPFVVSFGISNELFTIAESGLTAQAALGSDGKWSIYISANLSRPPSSNPTAELIETTPNLGVSLRSGLTTQVRIHEIVVAVSCWNYENSVPLRMKDAKFNVSISGGLLVDANGQIITPWVPVIASIDRIVNQIVPFQHRTPGSMDRTNVEPVFETESAISGDLALVPAPPSMSLPPFLPRYMLELIDDPNRPGSIEVPWLSAAVIVRGVPTIGSPPTSPDDPGLRGFIHAGEVVIDEVTNVFADVIAEGYARYTNYHDGSERAVAISGALSRGLASIFTESGGSVVGSLSASGLARVYSNPSYSLLSDLGVPWSNTTSALRGDLKIESGEAFILGRSFFGQLFTQPVVPSRVISTGQLPSIELEPYPQNRGLLSGMWIARNFVASPPSGDGIICRKFGGGSSTDVHGYDIQVAGILDSNAILGESGPQGQAGLTGRVMLGALALGRSIQPVPGHVMRLPNYCEYVDFGRSYGGGVLALPQQAVIQDGQVIVQRGWNLFNATCNFQDGSESNPFVLSKRTLERKSAQFVSAAQSPIFLSHIGLVKQLQGHPVTLEHKLRLGNNGWVNTFQTERIFWSEALGGVFSESGTLAVRAISVEAVQNLIPGRPYRLRPVPGALVCASEQNTPFPTSWEGTPVGWDYWYFRVTDVGCSYSDVAGPGASIGKDNRLDINDFILFVQWAFDEDPLADIAQAGGQIAWNGDGAIDNNDFVLFIERFFYAGCDGSEW